MWKPVSGIIIPVLISFVLFGITYVLIYESFNRNGSCKKTVLLEGCFFDCQYRKGLEQKEYNISASCKDDVYGINIFSHKIYFVKEYKRLLIEVLIPIGSCLLLFSIGVITYILRRIYKKNENDYGSSITDYFDSRRRYIPVSSGEYA
jgi:hypothetical protein